MILDTSNAMLNLKCEATKQTKSKEMSDFEGKLMSGAEDVRAATSGSTLGS